LRKYLSPSILLAYILLPNGLRLSRLAGCALIGSVYNKRQRRRHAPYLMAEGQVGSNRGLGVYIHPEE
jgi:hypothetical protein